MRLERGERQRRHRRHERFWSRPIKLDVQWIERERRLRLERFEQRQTVPWGR
jgi:hypothetical protein